MSDERGKVEDGFFEGQGAAAPAPEAARRRSSPLLRRSPAFAVLTLAICGWLLTSLWPDVAYHFSPQDLIKLGRPGAYALDQVRVNRLAQVEGRLLHEQGATDRGGAPRAIGLLPGTALVVDRPGTTLAAGSGHFEGRLLPAARRDDYAPAIERMRADGAIVPDRWQVLRDGERPRGAWGPVAGFALLLGVALINLRALVLAIFRPEHTP
ncbi:MAG: hypothetical protein QM767_15605 [Anaeromyxobacter sp.]